MKLDNQEKSMLDSWQRGEWKTTKNSTQIKKQMRSFASETLKKDKRINIRLSQKDLEGIQAKATRHGMPYQTLIASIIHKFIIGDLKEA